jgi:hypothetical protein
VLSPFIIGPCVVSQYTEQFVTGLQTQLEQSRLQEAELLGALKEMQDKVLDLEKVREPSSTTPVYVCVCGYICMFHIFIMCVCLCYRGAALCLMRTTWPSYRMS